MFLRRALVLLVLGGVLVVLWSTLDEPLPETTTYLAAADVGGRAIIVRTVPGPGPMRFEIGSLEDDRVDERTGEPRAVVAEGERLVLFFDDGAVRLPAPGSEGELSRVSYAVDGFRPLSASSGSDGILVVGRVTDREDALLVGRLDRESSAVSFDDGLTAEVNRAAKQVRLARDGGSTWVVWQASGASGTGVLALALGTPDVAPRTLLEAPDLGASAVLERPEGDRLLVSRGGGIVAVLSPAGEPGTSWRPEGLGESAEGIHLAAVGGEAPHLLALANGRFLAWSIGPDGPRAAVTLDSTPDLHWILLGVAVVAGILVAVLLLVERRTAPTAGEDELELAGPGRRLVAWALDVLLVGPLAALGAGLVLGVDLGGLVPGSPSASASTAEVRWLLAVSDGVVLLYFIVAEARFGRTIGKRALGLKTVGLDGEPPGLPSIVLRNVLRLLVDMYGGALLALLTERRQRVGDWFARTLVVRTRRTPPAS